MKLRKWVFLRIADFRRGHSYLVLLLWTVQFSTIIYVLLLEKVAWLKSILPHFILFFVTFLFIYLILASYLGYLDRRKGGIFRTETALGVQVNPVAIAFYKASFGAQIQILKKLGLDYSEVEKCLKMVKEWEESAGRVG